MINSTCPHNSFSPAEEQVFDNEVQSCLSKGIIKPSDQSPGDIVSPIFVTSQKDGTHRMIFNPKHLNQSASYHHFKLDSLQTAVQQVHPGCFMSTLDLKDAYYSIPMAEEHQKNLKFYWRNILYTFTCLLKGLSSSSRIFGKVMKHIFATLWRWFGHVCLNYIEDLFYIDSLASNCAETTLHAIELFSKLDFRIHPDKSVIVPSQTIEFLGFFILLLWQWVFPIETETNSMLCAYLSVMLENGSLSARWHHL